MSTKPYIAKVALEMKLTESRFWSNGSPLKIRTRGNGSTVPIAMARAVRDAFKHPALKGKSPTYFTMSAVVVSRWNLDDVPSAQLHEAEERLLDSATKIR